MNAGPAGGDVAAALPYQRIGPYRLERRIGSGGMGAVYLAVREEAFEQRVAIKVLRRGMDSEAVIGRFRHERQILARLDHPYIVGVIDGGTTADGLPFFAMDYVEGESIVAYAESHGLDTTARVELFRRVCAAVQYAHQNLVVHRDLKPSNVLVAGDGTPRLLDFGIAKLLEPGVGDVTVAPTVAGVHPMTPEYASPEQVRGEPVTTASDVYSLGVLLYELLTGRRPYQITSRAHADIARIVCEAVPVRPSTAVTRLIDPAQDDVPTGADPASTPTRATVADRSRAVETERLRRRLAGDLDTIVLKALSKEPERRYASVDQLSEDLRRHLHGLPVIARKDTLAYRAAKFVGRNRVAVIAAVLVLAALVAGVIGTAWQAQAARRERAQAEQRFDDVRDLANALLFEVHDAIRDLPGSTPARHLLVEKALAYLDRLARDAGDRPDLQRELAAAYLQVGDVQGRPLQPNLGDTAGALASYERAVGLYESLGAATSSDPALVGQLGVAYMRLADGLFATGDTSGALAKAREGLALQQRAPEAGAPFAARRELAAAHTRLADFLAATGDLEAALEHRRRALSQAQALAVEAPEDVGVLRQLGIAHQKLGNTLGNPNAPNVGDLAGGLEQLQQADEVLRRALAAQPTNAAIRRYIAVVHSNRADVLYAQKRIDDALEELRQARAGFDALAAIDPANAAAQNDLAIAESKVAELLMAMDRDPEALRGYERALAIHESLAAADPRNAALQAELASDRNRIATAQAKLGQREASLDNHARAVAISQQLSAANPDNVELRVAVALALGGRADAHVHFAARPAADATTRRADLESAERDYTESVAVLTALERDGRLTGTDVALLAAHRKELVRIRALPR